MVLDLVGKFCAVAAHFKTALALQLNDRSETMDIEFSAAPRLCFLASTSTACTLRAGNKACPPFR
jgi:hypothetical protein